MKKYIVILNLAFFFILFPNSKSLDKGIELADKENYKAAEVYLLKALNEDKEKDAHFYLALIYGDQKKYDLALQEYKKALLIEKINPATKNPFTHFYLAKL